MIDWTWCFTVDGGRVACFVTIDNVADIESATQRANEKLIEGQRLLDYDDAGISIYVDQFETSDLFQITCSVCSSQVGRGDQNSGYGVMDTVGMLAWMRDNCDPENHDSEE